MRLGEGVRQSEGAGGRGSGGGGGAAHALSARAYGPTPWLWKPSHVAAIWCAQAGQNKPLAYKGASWENLPDG